VGYKHTLSDIQIQLIAIGGAVGPGFVFPYHFVGVIIYRMMRGLGEMVVYRPTTGGQVSYAREFVGNRLAHLTGWIVPTCLNPCLTGVKTRGVQRESL
jgi:L-asparagine permease